MRRKAKRWLIATPLGSALFAVLALSPAAAQTYQACYVPKTGVVYRIGTEDTPEECRSDRHVEFSWTDAQAVPPAFAGAEVVYESSGRLPARGSGASIARCPEGKIAIAGGFQFAGSHLMQISANHPVGPGATDGGTGIPGFFGWRVGGRNETEDFNSGLEVWALCVVGGSE